jgi:hypothetical protein
VVEKGLGRRERRISSEVDGVINQRLHFLGHVFELYLGHAGLEQPPGRARDRISLTPCGEIISPAYSHVEVHRGTNMAKPAERATFKEGRTFTTLRTLHCTDGRVIHGQDVVPVHSFTWHTVQLA